VTSGALNNNFVTEASEFITPMAIQKTNAKLFPVGTLLVALYGEGKTRGKVSELQIEAATNQACAALLFNSSNSVLRPYLKTFLLNNYEAVRLLASGGVQPNLSLSIVKETIVPLPPLAEQARIVAEVERRLSVVEELEAVVFANLQRATRLRQSILQKAFTGGAVSQDLNDEPADKLLERIKNQPARIPEPQPMPRKKEPFPMPSESIESLDQLLERLDALGGSAAPERLLLTAGLGEDVEKFFDLLRAGRDDGSLSVPTGESGIIRRKRNAN